jgi:hypothetical protein
VRPAGYGLAGVPEQVGGVVAFSEVVVVGVGFVGVVSVGVVSVPFAWGVQFDGSGVVVVVVGVGGVVVVVAGAQMLCEAGAPWPATLVPPDAGIWQCVGSVVTRVCEAVVAVVAVVVGVVFVGVVVVGVVAAGAVVVLVVGLAAGF